MEFRSVTNPGLRWESGGVAQALHTGAAVIPLWPAAFGALFALGSQRRGGAGVGGATCYARCALRIRRCGPGLVLGSQRRGGLGGGRCHALDPAPAEPPRNPNAHALAQLPAGRWKSVCLGAPAAPRWDPGCPSARLREAVGHVLALRFSGIPALSGVVLAEKRHIPPRGGP